jgi:hypothetical protein
MATVGVPTAVTATGCVAQPPALQAVTVTDVTPGFTVTLQEKIPDALAVVVHRIVLLEPVMVTVLFGVAVPAGVEPPSDWGGQRAQ